MSERSEDDFLGKLANANEPGRRPECPAMNRMIGLPMPVLDHGLVRVLDYMGDDRSIVQAARVSYGEEPRPISDDRALIRYLVRNRHTSPLEMCELKLQIKLPIFVARQWIRHRTASVNEWSARYSIIKDEFYLPGPDRLARQSTANKQGSGEKFAPDDAETIMSELRADLEGACGTYGWAINQGLAREQARIVLPLATYTLMVWKIDLHNLLHFLALRMDPHAQQEIRAYADVIWRIVQAWVPITAEAFQDYRLDAVTIGGPAWRVLRDMLARGIVATTGTAGVASSLEAAGVGAREIADLMRAIGGEGGQ